MTGPHTAAGRESAGSGPPSPVGTAGFMAYNPSSRPMPWSRSVFAAVCRSLAPIRAGTWWEYKTPVVLGVAYATAMAGGVPFSRFWPAILAIVAALVPLASYVCVINDITDERDDARAGKSNRMVGIPPAFKIAWLLACLAGGCIAGLTCFRGNPAAAGLYAANWLAFTLYSVPPIRLKARGLAGVLADAAGGTLLPAIWSALIADAFVSPAFLTTVAAWAGAFGLRGILYHQAGDLECDRDAGVGTLAVRLGPERVAWLVAPFFLLEIAAFGRIVWLAHLGYAVPLFLVYAICQAAMWSFLQTHTVLVLPRERHRFAMLKYYQLWFPLAGLLEWVAADTRAIAAIAAHLVLFPETWWRFPAHAAHAANVCSGGRLSRLRQRLRAGRSNHGGSPVAISSTPAIAAIGTRQAPRCDLHWAGSLPDAHARYAEARRRGPVCFDAGQNRWCVLGYDAAVACLRDPDRFSSDPVAEFDPFVVGGDPPDHGRYRRITHDAVRDFDRAAVCAFCASWLDRFLERLGPGAVFDAVADLGVPLVDDFAGRMMGLRTHEIESLATMRAPNRTDMQSLDAKAWEFFSQIVTKDQAPSRDGVLACILGHRHDGTLTEYQAISLLRLLWVGSTATSNVLLPSAMMLLVQHQDIQSRLRDQPGLVPAFVSEALRLESPITVVTRRVTAETEFFDVQLRPNDIMNVCLLAANCDPAAFQAPEAIDLGRPAGRQIAFGAGIHHCLGGTIAKSLAETVVDRLLRNSTHLDSTERPGSLRYEAGDFRGLARLGLVVS